MATLNNPSRLSTTNPTQTTSFSLEEVWKKQPPNRLPTDSNNGQKNTSTTNTQGTSSASNSQSKLTVNGSSTGLTTTSSSTSLVTGSSTGLLTGSSTGLLTGSSTGLLTGSSTSLLTGSSTGLVTGSSTSLVTGSSTDLLGSTSSNTNSDKVESQKKRPPKTPGIPEELTGGKSTNDEPPIPPLPGQVSEKTQQNSGSRVNPSPLTFLPKETTNELSIPSNRESVNSGNQTSTSSSQERRPEDDLIPNLNHQKGTPKADELVGTDENDLLMGLRESDSLYGGVGSDVLSGGKGNDYIDGYLVTNNNSTSANRQTEIDILIGGKGADTLVLGSSAGSYYYDGEVSANSTTQVPDFAVLKDFNPDLDTIILSGKDSHYTITQGTMEQYLPAGISAQGSPNLLDTFILKNGDLIAVLADYRSSFTLDKGVTFI